MNILFILPQIHKGGGQAIQALNLAEYLIKKGNLVICLTFKTKGLSEEIREFIKKIKIYSLGLTLNYKTLLICPFLVDKLVNFMQDQKIEIIQTFDPHLSNLFGVLLSKKMRIPVICRIGAKYTEFYEDKMLKGSWLKKMLYYSKIIAFFLGMLEFYTIKNTNYVVANSFFILDALKKSFLLKKFKLNAKIIPNGVDLEKFRLNLSLESRYLEKLKENKIILFIGRIEDYKGIDVLIKAFAYLNKKISRLHLILVGSYHINYLYYQKLQKLIKKFKLMDKISFLGEISHNEIPFYLSLASILVLPSYSTSRPIEEGLPNVIIEAMATRRLVIASKIGGIPEIIRDEENGLLFEPGNYKDLGKLIEAVFMNPKKYEAIASNGKDAADRNYDMNKITEKYIELYKLILYRELER